MINWFNLQVEAFGLDISSRSLKIVQLRAKKSAAQFELLKYGELALPEGIISEGQVKDTAKLAALIKKLVQKLRLRTNYVVASLQEQGVFLQVVRLPKMENKETKEAVFYEAENYIPLPVNQVYLDSEIIEPMIDHLDHTDVLMVAMPKNVVDSYVEALELAGLRPVVLELESRASARAVIKNESNAEPVLIMDIGEGRTNLAFFVGHSIRFTSSINIAGQTLTQAIAKNLRIDLESAQKIKQEKGLSSLIAKNQTSKLAQTKIQFEKKTVLNNELWAAMREPLQNLVQQLSKYIEFYSEHASHEHVAPHTRKISKILLCGGEANLPGLVDFLAQQLNTEVQKANPWVNILPAPLKETKQLNFADSLAFTTALGLALRAARNQYD